MNKRGNTYYCICVNCGRKFEPATTTTTLCFKCQDEKTREENARYLVDATTRKTKQQRGEMSEVNAYFNKSTREVDE